MSEIQSLTERVQDLSRSVDWWNSAMIWGLALAAIAAVFVLVATRVVVTRAGQLSKTQDLLSEAKDRQLQSDLKAKDVEIGSLGAKVAQANERTEELRNENLLLQSNVLKLHARTEFRHLTPAQQQSIRDKVKRFSPLEFVLFVYSTGDDSPHLRKTF